MASVNKVILVGFLGKDPELFTSGEKGPLVNFSLATSSKWKDRSGEIREETEWHQLVAFGRIAEVIAEHCKKGSSLYVEGSLKTQKWKDKDTGQDRFSTKIQVKEFQFISSARQANDNSQQRQQAPAPQRQSQQRSSQGTASANNSYAAAKGGMSDENDQIPF